MALDENHRDVFPHGEGIIAFRHEYAHECQIKAASIVVSAASLKPSCAKIRRAQPRRTRRNLRRYLSTWVDWKASNLGEGLHDFRVRAMRDATNGEAPLPGSTLPWVLHDKPQDGLIRDFKRNSGTVQKDWAVVSSNSLPDHFCIAVVGHQGWSHDPDSTARYVLAVTFEILGGEITIYEPLRAAIAELQAQTEAEIEADEVEVEIEATE